MLDEGVVPQSYGLSRGGSRVTIVSLLCDSPL